MISKSNMKLQSKGPYTHKNGLQTMAAESLETSLHAVVLSVKEYNREWKYHSRTERKEHGNIRRQQDQTSE
jgi:hypothetical protein